MTFGASVYRVLIASPSDTSEARQTVQQALVEWNDLNSEGFGVVLLPVMWEMSAFPGFGRPQAVLNAQMVDRTDLVVAVFWTRLGTPTDTEPSGSVEEIRRKRMQGAHVFLYFSDQPIANPMSVDPQQLQAVQNFRTEMELQALIGTYDNSEALSNKVQRDLTRYFQENPPSRSEEPAVPPSSSGDGGANEPGPDQILESYKNELRGFIAQQRLQFENAVTQQDAESGRRVMAAFSQGLSQMVSAVASLSEGAANSVLAAKISDLTRRSFEMGHLQMYLDGGISWNRLVDGSLAVLGDASELLSQDWIELSSTGDVEHP